MNFNRYKMVSATVRGVLTLLTILFFSAGTAQAVSLSNTSVTESEVRSLFDLDNAFSYTETFQFDSANSGDGIGTVESGYLNGLVNTSAEGLYLYYYVIDYGAYLDGSTFNWGGKDSNSEYRVTKLQLEFGGLTPQDLNADGVDETSFWATNSPQGNYPNAGADYTGGEISFNFFCCNILDPSETSTEMGAASIYEWTYTTATLYSEGGASTTVQVIAPVPEPSMLLLLGTGLIGVGILLRRRNKEGQLGLY